MSNLEYLFKGIRFNPATRTLRRGKAQVKLRPRLAIILSYLIENSARRVSDHEIKQNVFRREVSDITVRTHIEALRKAIGDDGKKMELIDTIRNEGYRFVGEFERIVLGSENTLSEGGRERALPATATDLPSALSASLLMTHRVQRTDEPEFEQFLEVIDQELGGRIFDSAESFEYMLRRPSIYRLDGTIRDDILLVAKFVGDQKFYDLVAAVLYAASYPSHGYLHLAYLARNGALYRELREKGEFSAANEIRYKAVNLLLRNLAANLPSRGLPSKGVVIEMVREDRNEFLKGVFAGYARRLFNFNVYELQLEYRPPINIGELNSQEDLLYVPSEEHQVLIERNGGFLPHAEVMELLRFMYFQVYAPTFEGAGRGQEYREYARAMLLRADNGLPKLVPVMRVRSR